MGSKNCQKNYLMNFLSNSELSLCLNCSQISIKVAIYMKHGWNAIVWPKNQEYGTFCSKFTRYQNLV